MTTRMATKRRRLVILALALAVAGGAGAAAWYGVDMPASAPASPPPPVPVVAAKVTAHDVPIYLRGVGTVMAYNTVVVRSQVEASPSWSCAT